MGNAWFVRSKLDDTNMIEWFKTNDIVATKVRGANLDVDAESSIDLDGKSSEEIHDILSREPYKLEGELGNTRSYLDLFVNQMKIGDLVLVPDDRTIHFARIAGDYVHQSKALLYPVHRNKPKAPWLAHQRSVEWLEVIPRDDLSKKLRDMLKNHRLVGDVSRFYDEIEARSKGLSYEPKKETIEVEFHLRPDFKVTYTIPTDMTDVEAERLSVAFRNNYFQQDQNQDTPEQ